MSVEESKLKRKIAQYSVKQLTSVITCINKTNKKNIDISGDKQVLINKIHIEIDNCVFQLNSTSADWDFKTSWVIRGMLATGPKHNQGVLKKLGFTRYVSFHDLEYKRVKYIHHVNYSLNEEHILTIAHEIKKALNKGEKIYMECNRNIISIIFMLYGYKLDYILNIVRFKRSDKLQLANLAMIEKFLFAKNDDVKILPVRRKHRILSHAEVDRELDVLMEANILKGMKRLKSRQPLVKYADTDDDESSTDDDAPSDQDTLNPKDVREEAALEAAIDKEYEKWLEWFNKTDKSMTYELLFIDGLQEDIISISTDMQRLPSIEFLKEVGEDLLLPLGYDEGDDKELSVYEWVDGIYHSLDEIRANRKNK